MADSESVFLSLVVQRGLATQQAADESLQLSRSGQHSAAQILVERARIPRQVASQLYQEAQHLSRQSLVGGSSPDHARGLDVQGYLSDTQHERTPFTGAPGVRFSTPGPPPPATGAVTAVGLPPPPASGTYGAPPPSGTFASTGFAAPAATGWASGSSQGLRTPGNLKPGVVFNRYRLEKELGRGGMGVVWKGRQVDLERDVAIKMLLQGALASDKMRTRFVAEAKAVARLVHPNVVTVHDVGQEGGVLYFTMDFVDGPSLSQLVKKQELPLARVLELALGIAEGLEHAHKQGIVHRDLKPANILIDPRGTARITDFGIAKDTTKEGTTLEGEVLGTPHYMAPEQASGHTHEVDARADIYSFGAILYRMVAGRPPFTGKAPYMVINKVLREVPESPRKHNKQVSRELEAIILRCLEKKREERYEDATQLVGALQGLQRGQRIQKRVRRDAPSRPGASQRTLIIAVAAGLAVLLLGAIGLKSYLDVAEARRAAQAMEEEEAARRAREQQERERRQREALQKAAEARERVATHPGEALILAKQAAEVLLDDVELQVLVGRLILEEHDDPEDALVPLERALSRDARHVPARTLRARCLLALERPEEDIEAEALRLEEQGQEGQIAAAELRCDMALQDDELAVAVVHLDQAVREAPEDPRLRLRMTELLVRAKRFASAEEEGRVAAKLNPESARARVLLAEALLQGGRLEDAEVAARQALALEPDQPKARGILTEIERRQRRPTGGHPPSKLPNDPHDRTHAFLRKALAAIKAHRGQEAQKALDGALREQPLTCENALWDRVSVARSLKRYADALKDLEQLERLVGRTPQVLDGLARTKSALGRFAEALEHAGEAIAKSPESPKGYATRASVLRSQKEPQRAAEDLLKAIELAPANPEHYHQLTHVRLEANDPKAALEAVDHGVKLSPRDGHLHFLRGECLRALRRLKEAREAYKEAEKLGGPDAIKARERLKELEQ